MNAHEAKRDVKEKLAKLGVPYQKLTAKTWDFTDLARMRTPFVTIHGARYAETGIELKALIMADVPKPSEGGYCLDFHDCQWRKK